MEKTFAMISLGCAKNLVNSEQMLYLMSEAGYTILERNYRCRTGEILFLSIPHGITPLKKLESYCMRFSEAPVME